VDAAPSGPASGQYPEPALPIDSIRLEIRVIGREDRRKRLAMREIDKGCVRKIHWAVRIPGHQRLDCGSSRSESDREFQRTRSDELLGSSQIAATAQITKLVNPAMAAHNRSTTPVAGSACKQMTYRSWSAFIGGF
jgi:hypothetical protein